MAEKLLKVQEVSVIIGSSIQTINYWYKWKKSNPENELSKLLPDYKFIQEGGRKTRYWKQSDIWMLLEFKQKIVRGRNGIMGNITQKYVKKKTEENKK